MAKNPCPTYLTKKSTFIRKHFIDRKPIDKWKYTAIKNVFCEEQTRKGLKN